MANVDVTWTRLGLGIMRVTYGLPGDESTDTYPVFKSEPEGVLRYGPTYEFEGQQIATGDRMVGRRERPIAWKVTADEARAIAKTFEDAIRATHRQVFFADEDS
jgi:hypothetical protein